MSVWLAMPAADLEGLSALVSGGITANKTPIKSSASSQVRLLEFDYSRGPALDLPTAREGGPCKTPLQMVNVEFLHILP